ncbi:MAG: hypothetical protein IKO05_12005 [Selenomonadaceae bacterium]|nr:hypothetical protein [Selenomonadaceae bacterium]
MKTYTTKIAKNGATLYYSTETGKRIAKETALENERNYILTNGTVKERYELAKENFRFNERGEVERLWFHDVVSYGNRYNFKVTTKYEWYVVSDKDADYALQKYCRMTLAEFRAEVEVETEENVEVEETTTEQVAEVETEAQEVSKNFDADIRYEFNGGAGMDTSPNFATATEAAQWIIDFAANHPEYTFTGGRVHDNGNCKRYPFTDADITALNANKAAQEVSTEKVDIKEIIVEGLKQVDFSNVTKFEVGKTYFGATWEGKFNPNGAIIVKKLTVTKITPKTICTVDENGCTRRSKFTEAYAGTTEGFTIGTPNSYVNIYAFNEYTPAVAAVPTDNYTVWSEAIMAIKEGKTTEVNTVEEKPEAGEYKPQTEPEMFKAVMDAPQVHAEIFTTSLDFAIERARIFLVNNAASKVKILDANGKILVEKTCDQISRGLGDADEKSTEPAPELTGKMKWAVELLDNYTYEFEGDWEAGNGGLARHYKRFNRYGEECGKVVEVFTDKTSFILDHVNIVDKSIRTYYYINGEQLSYLNGEFSSIWSDKYKAGMSMVGGEHLQVEVPDGQWKKYKNFMVNDDEFFQIMSERGACTIAEENRKLDEAFTESESPATFKVGKTYLAERRRTGDELATFKILGRSAKFVTAVPVAFADRGETTADNDYVFQRRIYRDDLGDEYFMEPDNQTKVSAGKAYRLDEPAPVETKLPPVDTFTAKRDRLIAERDAANAKLKEAEEAFKAAKLAAFNADDAVMNFKEDAADELKERIDLPAAEIEVKTTEGNLAFICADTVYADFDDTKFTLRGDCSELNGLTLGTYDTPEQVMTAVEKFKAAIERGDKRFDFNQKPDAQNFNQALVA